MFLGPQFWDTVHISEVNGARKVKADLQTAMIMNKNSGPMWTFLGVGAVEQCPNCNFCPKRVEL